MTRKSKKTLRALLSSVMALVLCFSMLLGTTFAWFTDNASTAVNKIQSGTLDIGLEMLDSVDADGTEHWVSAVGKTLEFVKAEGAEDEDVLWDPGATYELPALRIANNGNLALKYKADITGIKGDAKLNEAIEWNVVVDTFEAVAAEAVPTETINAEYHLLPGEYHILYISGHMKEDAGNEYQGLTIDGVGITVYATQYTHESDSYGNTYDEDATLPSLTASDITPVDPTEISAGVYQIESAAQFLGFMQNTQDTQDEPMNYNGTKILLNCDIDFGGMEITGVASDGNYFAGEFDGQGHTISNFVINKPDNQFVGLFNQVNGNYYENTASVKNLNVENAKIIGLKSVGAIVGSAQGDTVVEDCNTVDCTVVATEKRAGGVVGYIASGTTVKNCTAKDTTIVTAGDFTSTEDADCQIVGYNNPTTPANTVVGNTYENVEIQSEVYTIASAKGLAKFAEEVNAGNTYAGKNIKLIADVDLAGLKWTPIGLYCKPKTGGNLEHKTFNGTFDGMGHTIKNLTTSDVWGTNEYDIVGAPALFGATGDGATIKNLTVTDALVYGKAAYSYASAVVGSHASGVLNLENVVVKDSILSCTRYVGGFVGIAGRDEHNIATGNLTNCAMKNITMYYVHGNGSSNIYGSAGAYGAIYNGTDTVTETDVIVVNEKSVSTDSSNWKYYYYKNMFENM